MLIPHYLETVFGVDVKVVQEFIEEDGTLMPVDMVFNTKDLGLLRIKEGKIIACDPYLAYDVADVVPFAAEFPKGSFMCQLAIASFLDDGDERVGFARIKFSDKTPVTWTVARTLDDSAVDTDRIESYGVDSGTGGFMDISAQLAFKEMSDADADYWENMEDKLNDSYVDTWSGIIWEINDTDIALFSSGYGDGVYVTYIGYDADGAICRLVTDFTVIDEDSKF